MDASDRALFERSLRHALDTQSGAALDQALDELGWRDALTTDAEAAVSVLFELQGYGNTTSSALERGGCAAHSDARAPERPRWSGPPWGNRCHPAA